MGGLGMLYLLISIYLLTNNSLQLPAVRLFIFDRRVIVQFDSP